MEPISPYSLLPETLRKWKSRRVLRQAAMECSVQTCNLRHARKTFRRKTNDFKRGRDVNGSKNDSCFKLFENSRCDLLMLAHAWPAMHHAMADNTGVWQRMPAECFCQELSRLFCGSKRAVLLQQVLLTLTHPCAAVFASQGFCGCCGQDLFLVPGKGIYTDLQGRRSAVESQYNFGLRLRLAFHGRSLRSPLPVAHFGHIFSVLGDVDLVPLHDLVIPFRGFADH